MIWSNVVLDVPPVVPPVELPVVPPVVPPVDVSNDVCVALNGLVLTVYVPPVVPV